MIFFEGLKTNYPITYELLPPRGCNVDYLEPIKQIEGHLAGVTITDNPHGNNEDQSHSIRELH